MKTRYRALTAVAASASMALTLAAPASAQSGSTAAKGTEVIVLDEPADRALDTGQLPVELSVGESATVAGKDSVTTYEVLSASCTHSVSAQTTTTAIRNSVQQAKGVVVFQVSSGCSSGRTGNAYLQRYTWQGRLNASTWSGSVGVGRKVTVTLWKPCNGNTIREWRTHGSLGLLGPAQSSAVKNMACDGG